jgi:hypothetical protein
MRYEMWTFHNGLKNAWTLMFDKKLPENKYVVLLGSNEWGEVYDTKEDLIKGWKRCLAMGYNQDVSLYFGNNLIRSVMNFREKITNKNIQYPCFYKKYLVESN